MEKYFKPLFLIPYLDNYTFYKYTHLHVHTLKCIWILAYNSLVFNKSFSFNTCITRKAQILSKPLDYCYNR